jgi:hypothetical protein
MKTPLIVREYYYEHAPGWLQRLHLRYATWRRSQRRRA